MSEPYIILYIEDNPDNQRLVQRVLGAQGHTVLLAEDGPTGLALARETSPSLILVDLRIPGLDGYETTTRLRSLPYLQRTPIVAITANDQPGAREQALIAGCDGYIAKPIDTRRLPLQISEFIAGKRETVPQPDETPLLRAYVRKLVERLEQQVRELSVANAELQELDRLKSQFLSTLSHELRTPLTSLVGYIELFSQGMLGPLNDIQMQAVTVMQRSADTLSQHLNNLLYLQEIRSTQLSLEPLVLHEWIIPLLKEMSVRAKQAEVRLQVKLDTVAPLQADGRALELVMRNLLDNAVKFNQPGGHILFTVRDEPAQVIVRVEDTGCGIPNEALEKIFLPFYRVDSSLACPYPGNGLGLAIVRHIVEAHGGQITVRSIVQRGSVFTIVLPREQELSVGAQMQKQQS
jgi:signal transduction histidine kinase